MGSHQLLIEENIATSMVDMHQQEQLQTQQQTLVLDQSVDPTCL